MRISERLKTIGDLVPLGSKVFDVGADHGLLEKYLLDKSIVSSITAIENKKGPYNILKNSLKDYECEVILSDGIALLNETSDTLVIAGMGGMLIANILLAHKLNLKSVKTIIVDPHRDQEFVRKVIISLGYKIEFEKLVKENNVFYNVMMFTKGDKDIGDDEIEFGYKLSNDKLFPEYKEYWLDQLQKRYSHLKESKNSTKEEIDELCNKISRLNNYEHD